MRAKLELTVLLVIVLITSNCKDPKDEKPRACGIEDPQINLEWLKRDLDKRFCTEVYTILFENQEYIGVSDCPEMVDGIIVFYDCQGNKVCEWGGIFTGHSSCFMPIELSYDYFEKYKKLIYKQTTK